MYMKSSRIVSRIWVWHFLSDLAFYRLLFIVKYIIQRTIVTSMYVCIQYISYNTVYCVLYAGTRCRLKYIFHREITYNFGQTAILIFSIHIGERA